MGVLAQQNRVNEDFLGGLNLLFCFSFLIGVFFVIILFAVLLFILGFFILFGSGLFRLSSSLLGSLDSGFFSASLSDDLFVTLGVALRVTATIAIVLLLLFFI